MVVFNGSLYSRVYGVYIANCYSFQGQVEAMADELKHRRMLDVLQVENHSTGKIYRA